MAKGHEIDPTTLSCRTGDEYATHALGKSNQRLILLDDTGRSYGLDAVNLPSARSQGEPISSMLNLANGTKIEQMTFCQPNPVLVASSLGYGFIGDVANMDTAQKSGKVVVNLDKGASLLPLAFVADSTLVAVVSSAGNLLIFSRDDLPVLAKGKGNKLIHLKDKDTVVAVCGLGETDHLIVHTNKRTLTLKPSDWAIYQGKRASGGKALPKGFMTVVKLSTEQTTESAKS